LANEAPREDGMVRSLVASEKYTAFGDCFLILPSLPDRLSDSACQRPTMGQQQVKSEEPLSRAAFERLWAGVVFLLWAAESQCSTNTLAQKRNQLLGHWAEVDRRESCSLFAVVNLGLESALGAVARCKEDYDRHPVH
jgi:hypothetical protein